MYTHETNNSPSNMDAKGKVNELVRHTNLVSFLPKRKKQAGGQERGGWNRDLKGQQEDEITVRGEILETRAGFDASIAGRAREKK
jgi:hypothetical protein